VGEAVRGAEARGELLLLFLMHELRKPLSDMRAWVLADEPSDMLRRGYGPVPVQLKVGDQRSTSHLARRVDIRNARDDEVLRLDVNLIPLVDETLEISVTTYQ